MTPLEQAKVFLTKRIPHAGFTVFSLRVEFREVDRAALHPGLNLVIPKEWELDFHKLCECLLHFGLHIFLLHHQRRGMRDIRRWNWAADQSVEGILYSFNLGGVYTSRTTEEMYTSSVKVPDDFVVDLLNLGSDDLESIRQISKRVASVVGKGFDSREFEEAVRSIEVPFVDWRSALDHLVSCHFLASDFSYHRISRRSAATQFVLPVPHKVPDPQFIVLWDSSGSFYSRAREILSYVLMLAESFNAELRVIVCDTEVHTDSIISSADELFTIVGAGGSDFTPAFDLLEREGSTSVVVAFTDGYIDVPERKPPLLKEVVWVTPRTGEAPAPWGDHLKIDLPGEF